jgi:hypothetical protein
MPVKLRHDKRRLGIHPSTVAFINGDRSDPDYPQGMLHFWHRHSVYKGHRHGMWGYTVEEACQQLGVDFAAVKAREFPPRPHPVDILRRWDAEEAEGAERARP